MRTWPRNRIPSPWHVRRVAHDTRRRGLLLEFPIGLADKPKLELQYANVNDGDPCFT
jgi:hypothetical protein